VPNAAVLPPEQPLTQDPTLLFLGTYAYGPNAVGANHLIADIWPLIRSEVPEARLVIAGQHPEHIPAHAGHPPGVVFTGFVDDLHDLYAKTRVVCCPILSGGGTRVKLVEAASFGKPLVSTRLGAEGIKLEPERAIFIRDEPRKFAKACVTLLRDGTRAQAVGAEARRTAADLYNRTAVVQRIQMHIIEGLGGKK
jgi:glycosyltransferase involved in cell wall biosynthesis